MLTASCLALVAATGIAQQTDNHELRAVPAPGKVVLDGKLDDWDLSGEILMCYDLESLLDIHSARAAATYDKDYLYVSFRIKDPTPMVNHAPQDGWRSDSVQVYFWDDPKKPIGPDGSQCLQVTCWWYTDGKRPEASFHFGRMGGSRKLERVVKDAIGKGVDAAFQNDPDGKGYVQEMRIAWKHISRTGKPYGAGASLRMGIECFWGDATALEFYGHRLTDLVNAQRPQREFFWTTPEAWGTVHMMDRGNLKPSQSIRQTSKAGELERLRYGTTGPVAINYEIPGDGYVTLVVEKPDGARVRNLISNYPRRAGRNTDYWDGADDNGRLVPPGSYRVRGLYHGDLDVLYEFAYGTSGHPPWPTGDTRGAWLSNHCNPMAVLADEQRIYVSAAHAEGPHPLIALDYDGNKVWGGLARWHACFMTRTADYLYVVAEGFVTPARRREQLDDEVKIELIRIDPETGKEVPFPDGKSRHVIAEWNIMKEGMVRQREGVVIANHGHDADWAGIQAQGLAALGDKLYVTMHFRDKLLVVDEATGAVTGKISVPDPAGLASDGKRLLAVSGRRIVEVNTNSGQIEPVVTGQLAAPVGLAVDKSGNIYVSEWADQMCVKVFSPDGSFQRTIGKVGGRPWIGDYDPQGMLLPRGISVDAQDRLWVAEDDPSPRRISCWEPDGTLALEKLGRPFYAAAGCHVFPDQPDRGVVLGNLVELDWDAGRWRVLGTPWRSTHPDAHLGLQHNSDISSVRTVNGRRFLVHTGGHGRLLVISELKNARAIPLAAVGACVRALPDARAQDKGGIEPAAFFADRIWTDERMNAAAKEVVPWFFKGPCAGDLGALWVNRLDIWRKAGIRERLLSNPDPNNNFVWSDLDGDGCLDADEVRFHVTPDLKGPLPPMWVFEVWSHGVADNDLSLYLSCVYEGKSHHWKLPVARWAESGAPVYDPDKAELIVKSGYLGEAAWVNERGELLTLANIGNSARGGLRDPLVAFRQDGSVAWTYPSDYTGVQGSHTAPKARRGLLIGPLGVMGEADLKGVGRTFAFHTNRGQAVLLTSDGLYLAELFRDGRSAPEGYPDKPRRGMSLKNTTNGGEWFGGQMFQRPDTGEVYIAACRSAPVITRVTGLETARRLAEQTVELTLTDYNAAAQLLATRAAEKAAGEAGVEKPLKIRPPKKKIVDTPSADTFDWRSDSTAAWQFDGTRHARAAWSYDEKNLYVCFRDVADETPMINSGEDVRRLFKFGDAAILELRTRPDEDSAEILPGDLRLLFSVHKDKPVAVLYRYRVPGVNDPVVFRSVKATHIDRIEILESAKIAIDREDGAYTLRASVSLSRLGYKPEKGKTYRGDFGAIYSDRAGMSNELRMHWHNKATGLVSDLSLEADIEPKQWGTFEVAD